MKNITANPKHIPHPVSSSVEGGGGGHTHTHTHTHTHSRYLSDVVEREVQLLPELVFHLQPQFLLLLAEVTQSLLAGGHRCVTLCTVDSLSVQYGFSRISH